MFKIYKTNWKLHGVEGGDTRVVERKVWKNSDSDGNLLWNRDKIYRLILERTKRK